MTAPRNPNKNKQILALYIPQDLQAKYRAKCADLGVSASIVGRGLIEEFLASKIAAVEVATTRHPAPPPETKIAIIRSTKTTQQ